MNKNLYSGKLIAVDGPNGAGKTTIIQELKKELEKRRIEACFTKEPTDNELGCFVREYAERFDGISVAYSVWKEPYFGDYNIVMSHIRNIREKIEDNPNKPIYIQTVWGVGYKFNNKLK